MSAAFFSSGFWCAPSNWIVYLWSRPGTCTVSVCYSFQHGFIKRNIGWIWHAFFRYMCNVHIAFVFSVSNSEPFIFAHFVNLLIARWKLFIDYTKHLPTFITYRLLLVKVNPKDKRRKSKRYKFSISLADLSNKQRQNKQCTLINYKYVRFKFIVCPIISSPYQTLSYRQTTARDATQINIYFNFTKYQIIECYKIIVIRNQTERMRYGLERQLVSRNNTMHAESMAFSARVVNSLSKIEMVFSFNHTIPASFLEWDLYYSACARALSWKFNRFSLY